MSSIRVNTDAILLGAWADVSNAENILEVGTGCGIVSLMMAQKNSFAKITAIDIDENSVMQAKSNFNQTQWAANLSSMNISFQEFIRQTNEKFDIIISNPPYFDNSLTPDSASRLKAKHTQYLHFIDIISESKRLLTENGKLIFIVPYPAKIKLFQTAHTHQFFPHKCSDVRPTPEKSFFRCLIELRNDTCSFIENEFSIQDSNHYFSDEYKSLTQDYHPEYYLNKLV
ncbi:MAG: methyltransferase [Bacteroidota bacterium]